MPPADVDAPWYYEFVVTELPPGAPLATVYGPPPYPGIVLDALVRALPTVTRTLEALHAIGKAHRALRPEVFLALRDRVLVA